MENKPEIKGLVQSPNDIKDFILNSVCNDVTLAENLWKLYHHLIDSPIKSTVQEAMVKHKVKTLKSDLNKLMLQTTCDTNGKVSDCVQSKHIYDHHLLGDATLILLCYLKLPVELQVTTSYEEVFLKYTPSIFDGNLKWGSLFQSIYSNDKSMIKSIKWNDIDPMDVCLAWVQLRLHFPNMPSHKPLINFEILRHHRKNHTAYIFIIDLDEFKTAGIYYKSKYIPAKSTDNLFYTYLKIYDVGLQ